MPVYQPVEYRAVIARIQEKVAARGIKMGNCLTEETIMAFETKHNVRLPQAYRLFLQSVGDGCDHSGFPLNSLDQVKPGDLSHPFMMEEPWIWEEDDRDKDVIEAEMRSKVYPGNIELIDFGCCNCFHLIVTGPCQGEVWNFTDVGVQPCCERQDFLGWFELWLDNQKDTDWFKDYVYE